MSKVPPHGAAELAGPSDGGTAVRSLTRAVCDHGREAGPTSLTRAACDTQVGSILLLTLALTHPGQPWTSPVAVVAVVAFVMSFGIGMGPVPWLLPAELFAMDKCAKGSGVAAASKLGIASTV